MRLGVRDWKIDLARTALGGAGSLVALTMAGWPSNAAEAAWVALGGLLVGLAAAFGAEYVVRLHREVHRLQSVEAELASERAAWADERKLYQRRVDLAKREADINAVDVEVWGGIVTETISRQHTPGRDTVPIVLARREAIIKARGLDVPIASD